MLWFLPSAEKSIGGKRKKVSNIYLKTGVGIFLFVHRFLTM